MLKIIIATMVFLSVAYAKAEEAVIKECTVNIKELEKGDGDLKMSMKVFANNRAVITQTMHGETASNEVSARTFEGPVRDNLTANSNPDDDSLTDVERLILHAMSLTSDPQVKKVFSSGIDLSKVRSVKAITLAENPTDIGSVTIVEAKDAEGKVLGSFLGGFLVSPCRANFL
jgi:hypothetical protein